ncbi:MAG: hypothetical protein JNJ55_11745 [Betaproteobacteria bacterium]|nr:hypothetical protein [Betaproteobacteria bacterium]
MAKSFKLQVQDDDSRPDHWRDVKGEFGRPLVFEHENDARAKLKELFPLLVKLEEFAAGSKRARVVVVSPYQDIDEERDEWARSSPHKGK